MRGKEREREAERVKEIGREREDKDRMVRRSLKPGCLT